MNFSSKDKTKAKGSNPSSSKGSNPSSTKGSNPPSAAPSRDASRDRTPDLDSRGRRKASVSQASKSKSREPSVSSYSKGKKQLQRSDTDSSQSSTAPMGIMIPRGMEVKSLDKGDDSRSPSKRHTLLPKGEKKAVLYVQEGRGGTFNFRGTKAPGQSFGKSERIGLHECMSCVGVYFQIDKERCFVAHINAAIPGMGQGDLTSKQKLEIRNAVFENLSEEARVNEWEPSMVDKATVLLVSGYRDGPAKPVEKGVQDFLGPGDPTPSIDTIYWGFVVRPNTPGGVVLLRYAPEEIKENYEPHNAKLKDGAWAYTTGGRGWEVPVQYKDPFRSDSD